MRTIQRTAALLALLFLTLGQAQTLSLQSAFPRGLSVLSESSERFAQQIEILSGGELIFEVYEAGALSPPFEILDNIEIGAIDAAWSYAGYWAGSMPAAALFGSIPFGPDAPKYLAWIYEGGGLELWQEMYAGRNAVPMPCGAIISEAGGWYRNEISSIDDFRGLNFRIGGLGGAVLQSVGAVPSSIPAGETYLALETGRLDGVELSYPAIDLGASYYEVARHYYFPGWHQPSGLIEFLINQQVWDGLTDAQRLLIETTCRSLNEWTVQRASVIQGEALDYLREQGVVIQRFPPEVIDALREATEQVLVERSADDEMFGRVMDSYRAFSDIYDEYQALSRLSGD